MKPHKRAYALSYLNLLMVSSLNGNVILVLTRDRLYKEADQAWGKLLSGT